MESIDHNVFEIGIRWNTKYIWMPKENYRDDK